MNEKTKEVVVNKIIHALTTDGADHKQWYLEEILGEIVSCKEYKDLKNNYYWEEGTPP